MNRFIRTLLVVASIFSFAAMPFAAAAAPALPALPASSQSFDSGMLHVDVYGTTGKPLVFIPGLGSGPWSWAEQITRFSKDHVVYSITLAGFNGRAFAPQPDLFAAFNRDFWAMLDARHIVKPVVIGHSLGGTLAILLAETRPERLAGVVALDGLPIFPPVANIKPAERSDQGAKMAAMVAAESPDQLLAYERGFMKSIGTTTPEYVEPTAQLEAKSDAKAIAAWLQADIVTDLRPGLSKASVPIVELMPYAQPSPYSKDQTLAFYQSLLSGAPKVTVVAIDGARHFAMLDQPQAVDAAITQFLGALR